MTNQNPRYPGCAWLLPYLMVPDVARSIDFYSAAFGFEVNAAPLKAPDGTIVHAELKHGDGEVLLMLGVESAPGHPHKSPATTVTVPPIILYLYVRDVDEHYLRARAAGARIHQPPADMFYGDRRYSAVDPDGYHWSFATHTGKFSEPPAMG